MWYQIMVAYTRAHGPACLVKYILIVDFTQVCLLVFIFEFIKT
jgi:hypothetical protein